MACDRADLPWLSSSGKGCGVNGPRASWLLPAIVVLAVVLRLFAVQSRVGTPLFGDEPSYDSIAQNLLAGHGYASGRPGVDLHPTAMRGPGYVLLLAASYRLFGPSALAVHLLQIILEVISLLLIHRLARMWFAPPAVAAIAAALYAVYPPFLTGTASLLSETFTQVTLICTVFLFFRYIESRQMRHLVGSALALGICALIKPQIAPVGVILCMAAIPRLGLARAASAAAIVVLVVTLVLSPWFVRNALVFHRFVPGLSTGGLGLWFGAGPIDGLTIGGLGDPIVPDSLRVAVARMDEMAADRWAYAEANRLIAADPGHYAVLTLKKCFRLWFNLGFDGAPPSLATLALAAFHAFTIALALYASRRAAPDAAGALFIGLLGAFWTVANVPFVAVVRYAFPYYALLFTFAAAGAWTLSTRFLRQRANAPRPLSE